VQAQITLNGKTADFEFHPGTILLDFLREQGLHSVKYSCDTGESGCDAVLVDGKLINSGIYLAAQAHKREVITLEHLGTPSDMHPIQEAFVECGAIQCGYCTPAMILGAYELLSTDLNPTEDQARDALSGVLCRCTGYVKPVEAILLAAKRIREGDFHGVTGHRQGNASPRRDEIGVR
jgi:putative selenate reductase molybdopterin-binding subunit